MSKSKKVAAETKVKLVQEYLAVEISQAVGAAAAGVSLASFQQWIMRYEAEGTAAL